MELIEQIEGNLTTFVKFLKLLLEIVSVVCIFSGFLVSIRGLFILSWRGKAFPFSDVRIKFGTWLALALEFQLGADILATTIYPSFSELGKLGIIAIIRTFLNYFLNKELEAEKKQKDNKNQNISS